MKLTIILTAAAALLRFDLPGPGQYYLCSDQGAGVTRIEASGYVSELCHVTASIRRTEPHKFFWVEFTPAQNP